MERKPKLDKVLTGLGLTAAAAVLLMTSRAGLASGGVQPAGSDDVGIGDVHIGDAENGDAGSVDLPETLTLTGTVRDFRERYTEGGHIDFEKKPDNGYGHYMGNVADQLDDDRKPSFSGSG